MSKIIPNTNQSK